MGRHLFLKRKGEKGRRVGSLWAISWEEEGSGEKRGLA